MALLLFPILHGGVGPDVTVVEYLVRVAVLLVGMGVIAVYIFATTSQVDSLWTRSDESTREQPNE